MRVLHIEFQIADERDASKKAELLEETERV
jgi:hypothetical protein